MGKGGGTVRCALLIVSQRHSRYCEEPIKWRRRRKWFQKHKSHDEGVVQDSKTRARARGRKNKKKFAVVRSGYLCHFSVFFFFMKSSLRHLGGAQRLFCVRVEYARLFAILVMEAATHHGVLCRSLASELFLNYYLPFIYVNWVRARCVSHRRVSFFFFHFFIFARHRASPARVIALLLRFSRRRRGGATSSSAGRATSCTFR